MPRRKRTDVGCSTGSVLAIRALALIALALGLLAAPAAAQDFRVFAVPGLELDLLERLAPKAAIGLVVPAAGPRTSEQQALAALETGEVVNSLRGGIPSGERLIDIEHATTPTVNPGERLILVGLPKGGDQANDRRYPIAVIGAGYEGLLVSDSTRIPGLVSIADVAPTALGREGGLRSEPSTDAVGALTALDRRIRANGHSRGWASLLVAGLLAVLAIAVSGRAAVAGFAAALAANLALGLAGASTTWVVLVVLGATVAAGGPLLAAALRSDPSLGIAFTAVVAAYLIALALDGTAVALSPLGPTQNARFYGLSNLLSTMLLVPTLAGAALLGRRYGALAFASVGVLGFATVALSSLGADGGGALVLAVGLVVLAAGLWELSGWVLALLAAGMLAAVGVAIAVEAAAGVSSHVTRALEDGPAEWLADLADRIELSFRRTTDDPATAAGVVAGLLAFASLVWLTFRAGLARSERALPLAYAAAIVTSLVVNDSPLEVTLAGAVGLGALLRFAAEGESPPDRASSLRGRGRLRLVDKTGPG